MSGMDRIAPLIVLTASMALLGTAYGFEYIGGLAPCDLCYYQRYPYMATIVIGLIGTWVVVASRGSRNSRSFIAALMFVAMLLFLTDAAVAGYHTGIELTWWPGPDSCTSPSLSFNSFEEFRDQVSSLIAPRCDEVPWEMLSISMAGWNGVAALGMAIFSFAAWRRAARPRR